MSPPLSHDTTLFARSHSFRCVTPNVVVIGYIVDFVGSAGSSYGPSGEGSGRSFSPFSMAFQRPHDDWNDDDIDTTPFNQLQIKQNLYRRPIKFVSASAAAEPSVEAPRPTPLSITEQYFAIVFPNGREKTPEEDLSQYKICEICSQPIKEATYKLHFQSHKHQEALPRIQTPVNIDRGRMGLKVLEKHGFDIDERKGLGANQQGRFVPIKTVEKRDRLGIGIKIDKSTVGTNKPKEAKMSAGQCRKKYSEDKKKAEQLQRQFYGDDMANKILGELETQEEEVKSDRRPTVGGFKASQFQW